MLYDNDERKDICDETSVCFLMLCFTIFTGLLGSLSWCVSDPGDDSFGACLLYKFELVFIYVILVMSLFAIIFLFFFFVLGIALIIVTFLYSLLTCSYDCLHSCIMFLKRIIFQCCVCSGDFCRKEIRLCHDNMITRKLKKLGTPYDYIDDQDI